MTFPDRSVTAGEKEIKEAKNFADCSKIYKKYLSKEVRVLALKKALTFVGDEDEAGFIYNEIIKGEIRGEEGEEVLKKQAYDKFKLTLLSELGAK